MRNDVSIWNVLHDGALVGLEGHIPGDVTATVEIEYLREMLPDPGDRFLVLLHGCGRLEAHRFNGDDDLVTDELAVITDEAPGILSARLEDDTVVVSMTARSYAFMELRLQYESFRVTVENGRIVTFNEIAEAADRYWRNFSSK